MPMGGRGGGQDSGLNLVELESLLSRFGVGLDQFASALGLTRAQLDNAEVSLTDLERLGITVQQLQQVGITLDDLRRIGIDVD